jgi:HK97 family phage portal protein
MSLLFRDKRTKTEKRGQLPIPVIPPFYGAGTGLYGNAGIVTPEMAMQVSAVWACVRLLADAVSMQPINAFRMQNGIQKPRDLPPLLQKPAADATLNEWLYMVMVSLTLRGNAYGVVTAVDDLGYPTKIELQHPDQVHSYVKDGNIQYWINQKPIDQYATTHRANTLWHMRAFRMPGSHLGLSPLEYAAMTIQQDLAAVKFGTDFFESNGHPVGVMTTDNEVTQEDSQIIKDRFMHGVRNRTPVIVGDGLKYQPIAIRPEESQFLATQQFNAGQIARFFGVGADMIDAATGKDNTYQNVEQKSINFLTYGVQPWLYRFENAFGLLTPGPVILRFDTSELLRTDRKTTMESLVLGIAAKMMTPDEARQQIDYPPLTEDQKKILELVPLYVTPTATPRPLSGTYSGQGEGLPQDDQP